MNAFIIRILLIYRVKICLSDHFCNGDNLPFRCYNTTFIYGNLELDFCVYSSLVCDGKADCDRGEDEENCIRKSRYVKIPVVPVSICFRAFTEVSLSGTCRPGQFRCGDGRCVDESKICDGEFDCVDAADERDCATCDADKEFRCEGGECIGLGLRCDGKADCGDGTDELDCPVCDPREGAEIQSSCLMP